MSLTDKSKIKISLKKLAGRAMTSAVPDEGLANEKYPTNVTVSATTSFAEKVPDVAIRENTETGGVHGTTGTAGSITDTGGTLLPGPNFGNGVVECVMLDLVEIQGSDYDANVLLGLTHDSVGPHAYAAQLPPDYEDFSNNPLASTIANPTGFTGGGPLFQTQGKVQCVPPIFGFDDPDAPVYTDSVGSDSRIYKAIPYDENQVEISESGGREWYFDYYNGILFQDRSVKDDADNPLTTPATIEVLLYIGDFTSDRIGFNSQGATGIVDSPIGHTGGYVWKVSGPSSALGTTAGWYQESADQDTWTANALGTSGYVAAPPSATGHYWGTTGPVGFEGTPAWLPIPHDEGPPGGGGMFGPTGCRDGDILQWHFGGTGLGCGDFPQGSAVWNDPARLQVLYATDAIMGGMQFRIDVPPGLAIKPPNAAGGITGDASGAFSVLVVTQPGGTGADILVLGSLGFGLPAGAGELLTFDIALEPGATKHGVYCKPESWSPQGPFTDPSGTTGGNFDCTVPMKVTHGIDNECIDCEEWSYWECVPCCGDEALWWEAGPSGGASLGPYGQTINSLITTSSVAIGVGSTAYTASEFGEDIIFFVGGVPGNRADFKENPATTSRGTAVFAGDLVVSGNLHVGGTGGGVTYDIDNGRVRYPYPWEIGTPVFSGASAYGSDHWPFPTVATRGYLGEDLHHGHVLSGTFIDIGWYDPEDNCEPSAWCGYPATIRQIGDIQTQIVFDRTSIRLIASDDTLDEVSSTPILHSQIFGGQIDIGKAGRVAGTIGDHEMTGGGNILIQGGDIHTNHSAPGNPGTWPPGHVPRGGSVRIFAGDGSAQVSNYMAEQAGGSAADNLSTGGDLLLSSGDAGKGQIEINLDGSLGPGLVDCKAIADAGDIRIYAGQALSDGPYPPLPILEQLKGGSIDIVAGGGQHPGNVVIAGGLNTALFSHPGHNPPDGLLSTHDSTDNFDGKNTAYLAGDVYLDGGMPARDIRGPTGDFTWRHDGPFPWSFEEHGPGYFGGRVLINTMVDTYHGLQLTETESEEPSNWYPDSPQEIQDAKTIDSFRGRACGIGEPEPLATLHITDNGAAFKAGSGIFGVQSSPLELTRLNVENENIYPLVVKADTRPHAPPDSWLVYRFGTIYTGDGGRDSGSSTPQFTTTTLIPDPYLDDSLSGWDEGLAAYRIDDTVGRGPYPTGGSGGAGPSGPSASIWHDNMIAVDTWGASAAAFGNGNIVTIKLPSGVDPIPPIIAKDIYDVEHILSPEMIIEGRELVIKDVGNYAGTVNIKIETAPGEMIDGSTNTIMIDSNDQFIRLKATGDSGASMTTPGWTIVG